MPQWQYSGLLFWLRTFYGLCAAPFLIFLLPFSWFRVGVYHSVYVRRMSVQTHTEKLVFGGYKNIRLRGYVTRDKTF